MCKCVISSVLPQPLHCQLTGSVHTSQFNVDVKRVPHVLHDHLLVKKGCKPPLLPISFFPISTSLFPVACFRKVQRYSRRLCKSDRQYDRTAMYAIIVQPYELCETYESNHCYKKMLVIRFKYCRSPPKTLGS